MNTRPQYASVNHGSILSVPGEVKAIGDSQTEITTVNNDAADYPVVGVMVKDVGELKGIVDEYGYRIRISIQGSDIEKISALKVTVTDVADPQKTVIYDPVPIEIQNGPTGSGSNFFAYAYLEYLPIVNILLLSIFFNNLFIFLCILLECFPNSNISPIINTLLCPIFFK